jgi:hypothetical protein
MAVAAVIDGALAAARTRMTEAFGRFGLTPTPKAPGVIQWNGSHDGRAWEAWLGARRKNIYYGDIRSRRTIGCKLHLEAETAVMMNASVMPSRVATNVVMRFLHRRGGLVLMPSAPPGLDTSAQLQPEDVDVEKVAATLQHLAALARATDRLPPPATPAAAPPPGGQGVGRLFLVIAALSAGVMAIFVIGALLIGPLAWLVLR